MKEAESVTPRRVRAGHLLAQLECRRLDMAMEGRFRESTIFADRAKRVRKILAQMNTCPQPDVNPSPADLPQRMPSARLIENLFPHADEAMKPKPRGIRRLLSYISL